MDIIGGQHLRQMWDDLADVYGHKTALICESSGGVVNRYSYLELNQEINRTANLFYTLGIRKGDKVALHLDNCPEFIFCWFGLAKIGAIMVPINARLLRESTWILQNSQACLLVTSAQFYPMYQQIQQEDASQLRHICLIDMALPADDGVSSFTQLKNQQPATLCYAPPLSTDDTAEILFTSGTTSRPKGVVITHYNLRFAGYYSAWQCALRDDDVYLTVMPAFHIDCQCTAAMAAFSAGATFVLVEKYSARAFWGQVQKYRATITECIPMMIRTLMVQPPSANDRQHRLREVMFYLNLSEQEKDAFCERFGVRLLTSYGMTETIVGIIGDRPGDKRRWPSIGRAGFCYEAEIRDDHTVPSRLVSSVKSVLKAYQENHLQRVFSQPESHCESAGSRWLATYRRYRIPRRRGLFLFRRSPLQYDQTRWRECLLRGARKYHRHPSKNSGYRGCGY